MTMNWVKSRRLDFSDVLLYGITSKIIEPSLVLEKVEKMLSAGIDAIQLRTRELTDRGTFDLALEMKDLCHRYSALFIVDNRPDIALAVDADGVHIGHEDLPIERVREILGHRKIIGVSTHSLPEALTAQKEGADYVSCGPIWATPTKPEYKPVGLDLIGLYKAALKIPFVVIGGIDETNIDEVVKCGAPAVAVVRAFFEKEDPGPTVQQFKEKILVNRIQLEVKVPLS